MKIILSYLTFLTAHHTIIAQHTTHPSPSHLSLSYEANPGARRHPLLHPEEPDILGPACPSAEQQEQDPEQPAPGRHAGLLSHWPCCPLLPPDPPARPPNYRRLPSTPPIVSPPRTSPGFSNPHSPPLSPTPTLTRFPALISVTSGQTSLFTGSSAVCRASRHWSPPTPGAHWATGPLPQVSAAQGWGPGTHPYLPTGPASPSPNLPPGQSGLPSPGNERAQGRPASNPAHSFYHYPPHTQGYQRPHGQTDQGNSVQTCLPSK